MDKKVKNMRLNVISWKRRKLVGAIALTFLVKFNLDHLVLIMTFFKVVSWQLLKKKKEFEKH